MPCWLWEDVAMPGNSSMVYHILTADDQNYVHNLSSENFSLFHDFDFQSILDEFKRKEYFTLHKPETKAFIVMYSVIFLMSIVGNISVLLVIIPNRRMWSVTNNFLLNMAVADLLGMFCR